MQRGTHLSLNALRMRSTSSSRLSAEASRANSFSNSASVMAGALSTFELDGCLSDDIAVGILS